jgi:imidazole glycerol-phosphate synthase subunit HisH
VIAILNYDVGNVQSIRNMLARLGYEAVVTNDIEQIQNAQKLILPGVGAFEYGMTKLQSASFYSHLSELVLQEKTPILGICLGAQLMLKHSEEGNKIDGLGWIDGEVIKFKLQGQQLRVPHMGWNNVNVSNGNKLVQGLDANSKFYFVHSFHFRLNNQKQDAVLTTNYGEEFVSAFAQNNIYGVQFHPEKSHKYGMQLLKNFAEL